LIGGNALDHVGFAQRLLLLRLLRRRGGADLRQPRVEPGNRVVQLPRDDRRFASGRGTRDLVDLAGDGIELLVNLRDIVRAMARQRRARIRNAAKIRGRIADRGIEPVPQRHAGAARGGLGPLAD
jgi:hypothetical protein